MKFIGLGGRSLRVRINTCKEKYKKLMITEEALERINKEKKEKTGILDLSNCNLLEIPQEIADFDHLRVLILSNRVSENNFLNEILKEIGIEGKIRFPGNKHVLRAYRPNSISNLDPVLSILKFIQVFICGGDPSRNFPVFKIENIENLVELKYLDLSFCSIKHCEKINNLKLLKCLDLSGNQIGKIENLDHQTALTSLDLCGNQIGKIENLDHLTALTSLDLSRNQIGKIENLDHQNALTSLDLSRNQIGKIENLNHQTALTSLGLSGNQITNIDPSVIEDRNCLPNLKAWKNEIKSSEINNFYKICLLGDTRVGKSSLLDRFKFNTFDPTKASSHAIILEAYNTKYSELKIIGNKKINLQFFDFGGQDIYHGTHRWFLKGRHLNIVLFNYNQRDIIENERKSLEYWINICIQNNSENPIIIVQSKCKRDNCKIPAEFNALKKLYPQILDKIVHIDSEFDDTTENGFDTLRESIGVGIQKVLGFEMEIPQSFDDARNYLIEYSRKNKEIDHDTLRKLAKDDWNIGKHFDFDVCYNLLLKWLQGVGVIFYNENIMGGRIILDQKWAIEAIYSLFKQGEKLERQLKQNKGKINLSDIYENLYQYNDYEKDLLINYLKSSYTVFEVGYNFYHTADQRFFICPRYLPHTSNLEVQRETKCNFVIEIENFSRLDFIDLISILNSRIHINLASLCQTKFEFDYLHYCNGQIHFKPNKGIFISLLEHESTTIEPVIRDAIESLGYRVKDPFNQTLKEKINFKPTAKIFISYSHKYAKPSRIFIDKFKAFTNSLPNVIIDSWDDDKIFIGDDWHERIQAEIEKSNLCILLLCQDFFNSQYIQNHELRKFLELNEANEYPILPILLGDYVFQDHEAILERQIFMPEASLFDDIPGDKISFNKLIYHRAQIVQDAITSPNVDTYFMHFRKRLDGVLEGIKSKLK